MGVSLERVQFKFASIVGELCNEPDVLSQFAVWLDLRLAEYKLKGAISLDCSGEEPEASWMKGLKKCNRCGTDRHKNRHESSLSRRQVSEDKPYSSMSPGSNSPDFTIIKTEPQEIFPLELHENSSTTCSVPRKRPSAEGQWLKNSGISPSKRQYLKSSNSSAANQSLLSVIGDVHEIDAPVDPETNNQNDEVNFSSEQFLLESNNSSTSRQGTSVDPSSGWSGQQGTSLDLSANATKEEGWVVSPPIATWTPSKEAHRRLDGKAKRISRIVNLDALPKQTLTNIVVGAGIFERWLWTQTQDYDSMLDVPPPQLNEYLADFFSTVRQRQGLEYKLESYQALKVSIDRYLKECHYPEPVKTSSIFQKARQSYQRRRKTLVSTNVAPPPMKDLQLMCIVKGYLNSQ